MSRPPTEMELHVLRALSLTPQTHEELRVRLGRRGHRWNPRNTLRNLVGRGLAERHGQSRSYAYTLASRGEAELDFVEALTPRETL